MTSTDEPLPSRRRVAVGSLLGVILVVLGEFALLTVVYHSGDGADRRHEAWSRVVGAQSGWTAGSPTTAVQRAVARLDDVAGSRVDAVDRATAAWVADPTSSRFGELRATTTTLGTELSGDQTMASRRAALIHGLLLALASVGWFFWFRRVVRKQRDLQRSLTEFEVAMVGERRLTALVRNSVDLVVVIDPDTTISFASPSTQGVLGRDPHELLGARVLDVVSPQDAPLLTGLLSTGGSVDQLVLLHAHHADGRELVLEGSLTNLLADESVNGWVLTVRDVTERLLLQSELSHQAMHDQLTGLANRRLFTDRLSHALRRRDGATSPLVVLFMDIDDFKSVNDSSGHSAGDELLRVFAGKLQQVIRRGDTAARLGGDEFAVLMEDSDLVSAEAVAEDLRRVLSEPTDLAGVDVTMRASVGVAQARPGEASAEEVLRNADVAMYFAKDRGKARVAVYDSELHASALRRLEVRSEISAALAAGEFVLHYQPAYRFSDGEIDGYEALVRWQHPEDGMRYPDQFIEIAEQSGLIVPLGRWVLREACRAAAQDLTTPDATPVMSVNVSTRQLVEPDFYEEVLDVLASTGLDPGRLVLEITETALLEQRGAVVATLERLNQIGVRVAIDDFGTGYCSLSYLAELPAQVLKIDRSFVLGIGSDREPLVQAIIAMGESLGMITLAEGVEDVQQSEWLRAAGVLVGQGYLWARPMPLAQARAGLLAARPAARVAG